MIFYLLVVTLSAHRTFSPYVERSGVQCKQKTMMMMEIMKLGKTIGWLTLNHTFDDPHNFCFIFR